MPRPKTPYEQLEEVTGTLEKERKFFDALIVTDSVAIVANRIIHLVSFFRFAERIVPVYLENNSTRLFADNSMKAAETLYFLLVDIVRSARLAAYLCVKGIPDQALAALRGALEQIGVYTHVWHIPDKYRFVPDSDSKEYARAFRTGTDKINNELKAQGIKFRFMHCKGAKPISQLYALLSTYFIHGDHARTASEPSGALSCEFIDRGSPISMAGQFEMVQCILTLVYMELLGCIREDEILAEELAPLSIVSGLLLPIVGFAPQAEYGELSEQMLDALRSVLKESQAT